MSTKPWRVLRFNQPQYARQIAALNRHAEPSASRQAAVAEIISTVRKDGDDALVRYTKKFDGVDLTRGGLVLPTRTPKPAPDVIAAVDYAIKSVRSFSRLKKPRNWSRLNREGARVGEKFDPLERIGVYVPGGTAPLVSTALMTVTLARVAGCKEIVVCTPCGRNGAINPALLFAVRAAGATEIYRAGGAQAIAAMAYGTKTIRRVQKIFGPGNAYVVTAKRLLFGRVAIDSLPGPSEVLVLADETANPKFAAADLLAQAEHGSGHEHVWLVTTSPKILRAVESEITKQLPKLARREFIQRALDANGWLIQAKTLDDAIALANDLAPEHCEIMTRNPRKVSEKILTAGAIFLGPQSPTVLGDYVAGPSHTLPTGGAGAGFPGLTVDQFQRRTSIVEYDRASLKKALTAVKKFAELEGLDAHGKSAEIRTK